MKNNIPIVSIAKKIVSYLFPIPIYKQSSAINRSIEVVMYKGKLMIDTPNTNYSYGSLQRILRFGLKKVGFQNILQMQHILILGMAGGSVVKTLVDEMGYSNKITAVDLDKDIVDLACKYFKIDEIDNLSIVIDDAEKFVDKTKQRYDFVIIDIFQDNVMPDFLFREKFINQVAKLLTTNGIVLFNTMKTNKLDVERNKRFLEHCNDKFSVQVFPNVQGNELFIITKK